MIGYDWYMPISQEKAQRGACDACGRVVWAIDFEPLPGVTVILQVHHEFGGEEVTAFSCSVDSAHTAQAVQRVLAHFDDDGPPALPPPPTESSPDPEPAPVHNPSPPQPEQSFDSLIAAVKRPKRPPERTDDELRSLLREMWHEEGTRPSIKLVKQKLRVGEYRAKRLLESVEDPT